MALEAMEGTDEVIRRAGRIAGTGCTVVKLGEAAAGHAVRRPGGGDGDDRRHARGGGARARGGGGADAAHRPRRVPGRGRRGRASRSSGSRRPRRDDRGRAGAVRDRRGRRRVPSASTTPGSTPRCPAPPWPASSTSTPAARGRGRGAPRLPGLRRPRPHLLAEVGRGLGGGADRRPPPRGARGPGGGEGRPGREADDCSTLAEAEDLIALAARPGPVLQVGHIERFNPAIDVLRGNVVRPRFIEVHRLGSFSPRSLDIDVVLDLMIHDLDIVLTLDGSEAVQVDAVGVPVLTPRVDIANARLRFASGLIANLTASRVSAERVRKFRVFSPRTYISVDFAAREAQVYRLADGAGRPADPVRAHGRPRRGAAAAAARGVRRSRCGTASEPVVSGADGLRALRPGPRDPRPHG